jgi:chemotaxis protein MotB
VARKKKPPEHENHERWLVSYADFITLLFAFFVVMFASSQTDKDKVKQISDAVTEALKDGKSMSIGMPPKLATILGGTVGDTGKGNAQMKGPGGAQKAAKEAIEDEGIEVTPSMKRITKDLEQEIKDGKVEVSLEPRGLVVSLKETAFFTSGEAVINVTSYPTLAKLADVLKDTSNPLHIEGHTDAQPIHNSRFQSNWELSAARSIAMMEALSTRFAVDRKRMAIVGYADNMPEASNDTPEGRAKNRRVDIVIQNQQVVRKAQPKKAAEPAAKAAPKK